MVSTARRHINGLLMPVYLFFLALILVLQFIVGASICFVAIIAFQRCCISGFSTLVVRRFLVLQPFARAYTYNDGWFSLSLLL